MEVEEKKYTVTALAQAFVGGSLQRNPEYQRGASWKQLQQQGFLDSVMRGYPVPALFLHRMEGAAGLDGSRTTRWDIVDGQQRLIALRDYLDGKYPLQPIAEDSKGLFFAPYLVGERTPYADTSVRGMFAGLSPDHNKGHFVRAVMEGTAFALRDAQEIMKAKSVRVTGGGMKSPVWRQIIADVLGIPVVTVNTSDEGAAYGSAILAGVGIGAFKSVEAACDALVAHARIQLTNARDLRRRLIAARTAADPSQAP